MHKRLLSIVIIPILFFFFTSLSYAQSFQIRGTIVDGQNNPISDAMVNFTDESGKKTTTSTNPEGVYSQILPKGSYTILVTSPDGTDIPQAAVNGKLINGDTTQDFSIASTSQPIPNEVIPAPANNLILYILGGVIVIIAATIGFFYRRNRITKKRLNTPPQE